MAPLLETGDLLPAERARHSRYQVLEEMVLTLFNGASEASSFDVVTDMATWPRAEKHWVERQGQWRTGRGSAQVPPHDRPGRWSKLFYNGRVPDAGLSAPLAAPVDVRVQGSPRRSGREQLTSVRVGWTYQHLEPGRTPWQSAYHSDYELQRGRDRTLRVGSILERRSLFDLLREQLSLTFDAQLPAHARCRIRNLERRLSQLQFPRTATLSASGTGPGWLPTTFMTRRLGDLELRVPVQRVHVKWNDSTWYLPVNFNLLTNGQRMTVKDGRADTLQQELSAQQWCGGWLPGALQDASGLVQWTHFHDDDDAHMTQLHDSGQYPGEMIRLVRPQVQGLSVKRVELDLLISTQDLHWFEQMIQYDLMTRL